MKVLPLLAALPLLAGGLGAADAATRKAQVPNRFDGSWSIEVITESGSCDRAYRYGVIIENGQARYAGGGDFTVTGRVQPSGAVRATISRGDAAAQVVGRLGQGMGNGNWTRMPWIFGSAFFFSMSASSSACVV